MGGPGLYIQIADRHDGVVHLDSLHLDMPSTGNTSQPTRLSQLYRFRRGMLQIPSVLSSLVEWRISDSSRSIQSIVVNVPFDGKTCVNVD
jgi:hypothetical protein